ncbi:MAG: TIGR04282 family arsenosugar biosynthesis glycosyltransferase [Flavobacteriaceae bacterium]
MLSEEKTKETATTNDFSAVSKSLLLIFTRNPELGKCKTRLAATIGDQSALDIYNFLLRHTVAITKDVPTAKHVYYSEEIWKNDIWDESFFNKKLQKGLDLGERMANAFLEGFEAGYKKICIVGSDMFDLNGSDIENAFLMLNENNFVIGPATDGGYYLLGMTAFNVKLFKNKKWGTETVLKNTQSDLRNEKVYLLKTRNDIDRYEDIKDIKTFQPFLKNL